MKTPIALALLATLAFATSPAGAAERACRPSLSNFYHCPDTAKPQAKTTETPSSSGRTCRPSLSNLWTCPGTSQPSRKSASTGRRGSTPTKGQTGANQYSTETLARAHCPPTRLSGQIPGRTSITSAEPTITATRKPGHICVSRTRSPKGCAQQEMKSTLDTSLRSKAPQNRLSSTVHLNRPPYFVHEAAALNRELGRGML